MNLENLGVQEMSAQEAMKIEGGHPLFRKALEWLLGGAAYDAVSAAGSAAFRGYVKACGNGTYDGIPGCRR